MTLIILLLIVAFLLVIDTYFNFKKLSENLNRTVSRYLFDSFTKTKPRKGVMPEIPNPDQPLHPFTKTLTTAPSQPVSNSKARGDNIHYSNKLRTEFEGQPELHFLNAVCIGHLRRDNPQEKYVDLFFRIWAEEADFMLKTIDVRWLLSALGTFEKIHKNAPQSQIGTASNIFFNMLRIYEAERMSQNLSPTNTLRKNFKQDDLTMGFTNFALIKGDSDKNIIRVLARLSKTDPIAGPMLEEMIHRLAKDQKNIFSRIEGIRERVKKRKEQKDIQK